MPVRAAFSARCTRKPASRIAVTLDDEDLLIRERHVVAASRRDMDDLAEDRRHGLVAGSLHDIDEIGEKDRGPERGDERGQAKRAAQAPVGHPLDDEVPQRGQHHRGDEHEDEDKRQRGQAEDLRQRQKQDQRDKGREHEHVAMGEIDHADDAEHHRVADGDQAVDRAERDAVDELLEEDVHKGR